MSSPQPVTLQKAYEEACLALGEATLEKRLMSKAAAAQIEQLTAQLAEHARAAEAAEAKRAARRKPSP